jgi:uncharacterized membrane protein YfcA
VELLGLGPAAWGVAVVVVLAGSVLQSTTGFGLGLVSAPVLVLIDPTLVPTVVLGIAVPLALVMVVRYWGDLDTGAIKWALVGRFAGAVAGSGIVVALGSRELSIAFALSLLLAVGVSVARPRIAARSDGAGARPERPRGIENNRLMVSAGFLSGAMGTATSVGGPVMALALQHETGPRLRAMMASFMAFGGLLSLLTLAVVGELGGREATLALVLAPLTLIGLALSRWTVAVFDRGYVRQAVLAFATVAAAMILARALWPG